MHAIGPSNFKEQRNKVHTESLVMPLTKIKRVEKLSQDTIGEGITSLTMHESTTEVQIMIVVVPRHD